jgi:hypothetical protein
MTQRELLRLTGLYPVKSDSMPLFFFRNSLWSNS